MPDYRRYLAPGATYFFTVVTDGRAPLFRAASCRAFLRTAFDEVRRELPFEMPAVVLLPEHLHAIWMLPSGDADYSRRWGRIKKRFTEQYLSAGWPERAVSAGRAAQRRRGVWQPRFWEHLIRDEQDYDRRFDYIHYNPVKHGHVTRAADWEWSTFRRWVAAGVYPTDWGCDPTVRFAAVAGTVGE